MGRFFRSGGGVGFLRGGGGSEELCGGPYGVLCVSLTLEAQ